MIRFDILQTHTSIPPACQPVADLSVYHQQRQQSTLCTLKYSVMVASKLERCVSDFFICLVVFYIGHILLFFLQLIQNDLISCFIS